MSDKFESLSIEVLIEELKRCTLLDSEDDPDTPINEFVSWRARSTIEQLQREKAELAAHVERFANIILSDRFPDSSAQHELVHLATRGKPRHSLAEIKREAYVDGYSLAMVRYGGVKNSIHDTHKEALKEATQYANGESNE